MSNQDLGEIELHIEQARHYVDLGKALERLERNPDFQAVIQNDYLKQNAIRLVHLKADPSMRRDEYQRQIDQEIQAVGALAQYFNVVRMQAEHAALAIAEGEDLRDELAGEEAEV